MIDNIQLTTANKSLCCKKMQPHRKTFAPACYADFVLTVIMRKVMASFLEIGTILSYIIPFLEIVALRSGELQIIPLAINGNRFAWLVCHEI